MVRVGGLVPPFLVPVPPEGVEPHVGTSDIDLAIGVFAPEEEAYVSLVRALKDCGFRQRQPDEPSFRWFGSEGGIEVVLEILCPQNEETQRRIRERRSRMALLLRTSGGSDAEPISCSAMDGPMRPRRLPADEPPSGAGEDETREETGP
ncbi:MAG: hypothetical protein ACRELA_02360 [Candidatus Rokuibacteriota bacterium]